jgi:hypothetical protein
MLLDASSDLSLDAVSLTAALSPTDEVVPDTMLATSSLAASPLVPSPAEAHLLQAEDVSLLDDCVLDVMSDGLPVDDWSVDESRLLTSADVSVSDDASVLDALLDLSLLDLSSEEPSVHATPCASATTGSVAVPVQDEVADAYAAAAAEGLLGAPWLDCSMLEDDLALLDAAELMLEELADEVALRALTGSLHAASTPIRSGTTGIGVRTSVWATARPHRLHRGRSSLHRPAGGAAQPTQPLPATSPSPATPLTPPTQSALPTWTTPPSQGKPTAHVRLHRDVRSASQSGSAVPTDRGSMDRGVMSRLSDGQAVEAQRGGGQLLDRQRVDGQGGRRSACTDFSVSTHHVRHGRDTP